MDFKIQRNLCKGLRAAGLPKVMTYKIMNRIVKWFDSCGPEWTVSRIKEYRQWYENYLAENSGEHPWFGKTSKGTPKGDFGWLFKQPKGKVLSILSASTNFYNKVETRTQRTKFHYGLDGNGFQFNAKGFLAYFKPSLSKMLVSPSSTHTPKPGVPRLSVRLRKEVVDNWIRIDSSSGKHMQMHFPKLELPTAMDVTGKSVPISTRTPLHPKDVIMRWDALIQSWNDLPRPTIDFLIREDHQDWMPYSYVFAYQQPLKKAAETVGRIGLIQEPELKGRFIANPNRVTQKFMEPLQKLYQSICNSICTDYTLDQEAGVRWVQSMLSQGVSLTSSDLTSASDLLSLDASLKLVDVVFQLHERYGLRYTSAVQHFVEISRSQWDCPFEKGTVSWKQGQPLGTNPSFPLMAITNNIIGALACLESGVPINSFAVIGDDMIIDTRAADTYARMLQACGGELNPSKSICSAKIAEFAGRIILPERSYLKKINYVNPSDNSFMAVMAQVGPTGIHYLKPRQRKVFNQFRYVPGVIVDGPWLKDSYGEPLSTRYDWYLNGTSLSDERVEPDRKMFPVVKQLLDLQINGQLPMEEWEEKLPLMLNHVEEEDYLSSLVSEIPKESGDPRRQNGLSTLEWLEKVMSRPGFQPYKKFSSQPDNLEVDEIKARLKGQAEMEQSLGNTEHTKPKGLTL